MINFLGKFIPNLTSKTACLRELLQHNTVFEWTARHEREWKKLKETVTNEPVLAFFDPSKPTKISTDASKDGLGAVLLQMNGGNWQPVAYASRSMTETEQRYSQIQKETLGLVFGCGKFHSYVRMMMALQRYDFELIYTPGKYIVLADALSRAPAPSRDMPVSSTMDDAETQVNMVTASLPASDVMLQQIAQETAKDPLLQKVSHLIQNGWPKECMQFYSVRADLCVANGLLLRQNRIVIPLSMCQGILQRIHEGHLVMEKCKRRAREAVY